VPGRRSRARPPNASILLPILLLGLVIVHPRPVRAQVPTHWLYPTACNAAASLQICIDHAAAGDDVAIDTDTPILESVTIGKSLELRSAAGFHPTIQDVTVSNTGASKTNVSILGLEVDGAIHANFTLGSGHSLTVRDVHVFQPKGGGSPVGGIVANTSVPSSISLIRDDIRFTGTQTPGIKVSTSQVGLVIVKVIANQLSGARTATGGPGIELVATSGLTRAVVDNNVVRGVAGCGCFGAAGVSLLTQHGARAIVDVVGNTVDHSASQGLSVSDGATVAGHVSLDLFNDVFSHVGGAAVRLASVHRGALSVAAGYNDVFKAGGPSIWGGHAPGPGNLTKNPKYVDEGKGNLALSPGSPLIDGGLTCSPGGVADPDAAGRTRLGGVRVDMGAFERLAAPLTGAVFLGTGGQDTLIGTRGADIVCGYGGKDQLKGGGGNDYVDGGPGPDVISGGPGADTLVGGPGADRLLGGPGPDPCLDGQDGVHGNDLIDGGPGRDGYRADTGDVRTSVEFLAACH
jgi:Ca2+-binding RTX toxin-like protein